MRVSMSLALWLLCIVVFLPTRGSTGNFLQDCHPGPPFSGATFLGLTLAHEVCSKPRGGLPHFIHSRVLSLVLGRPRPPCEFCDSPLDSLAVRSPPPSLLLVVFCENSNEQTQSGAGPEDMGQELCGRGRVRAVGELKVNFVSF